MLREPWYATNWVKQCALHTNGFSVVWPISRTNSQWIAWAVQTISEDLRKHTIIIFLEMLLLRYMVNFYKLIWPSYVQYFNFFYAWFLLNYILYDQNLKSENIIDANWVETIEFKFTQLIHSSPHVRYPYPMHFFGTADHKKLYFF